MCHKIAYEGRGEAVKAMRVIGKHKGFRGGKPQVYLCEHCGAWHWGHRMVHRKWKVRHDRRWGRENRV